MSAAVAAGTSAGGLELARLIRSGELSSREVVQRHLDRIDEVNDGLNAVVRRFDEQALAAAERADAAHAAKGPVGPLHGVPITLKENIDLEGHPTTLGCVALADAVAAADEPMVARLKAAGAIPIGRTNLPDMAMRLHTDSGLHGPTVNPWNPAVTPGGSSGGEAVAVATGMSPLGFGGDMCGSLRWPSQCCGVATLKPTLGAVPRPLMSGLPYGIELMAVLGPIARSVADLRAAFAVIAGVGSGDPWSYPAVASGAAEDVAPGRIAISTQPGSGSTHPNVVTAVEHAAQILEDAGWQVHHVDPPRFDEAARLWPQINHGNPTNIDFMLGLMSPDAHRALQQWAAAETVAPDGQTFADALQRRSSIIVEWADFFATNGLWLTATATDQPFTVGADLGSVEEVRRILDGHRVIMATNSLGLPSTVVPVGIADDLPQSVQIVGPRFAEQACLDAAQAIETAAGILTPINPRCF